MTKKSRKFRKAHFRASSDALSANKENSFSNMFCRKGDFRTKTTDCAVRSCSAKKKPSKEMKKEETEQRMQLQSSSGSKSRKEFVSLISWKISSVSFFIPLNSQERGYQEVSPETLIDWSNLLFYRCSTPALLSYYPTEEVRRMYFYKPTVLPELRLKCRTVSESSTNSEDSFICFEDIDDSDDACDYDHDKMNCYTLDKNRFENLTDDEQSSSEEGSPRKKKVRFVDNSRLVTVHVIVAWDYAYRAARISQWMTMACDAKRFKQKIQSLEPILSPVLDPQHRAKIWETRMHNEES